MVNSQWSLGRGPLRLKIDMMLAALYVFRASVSIARFVIDSDLASTSASRSSAPACGWIDMRLETNRPMVLCSDFVNHVIELRVAPGDPSVEGRHQTHLAR